MKIESYLEYLQYEKRYSRHTLTAYSTDLGQFEKFIFKTYEINTPEEITHHFIRSWIVSLMEEGQTTRSVNRKISSLKSYFRFLKRSGDIKNNPMLKIISPKSGKRLPAFIEERKMESLLGDELFQNDFTGVRDKILLELLYNTGIRLSELINISEDDINRNSIKVLGKRNKERVVPISNQLEQNINQYLTEKNNEFNGKSDSYLLVTDKGKKLYEKFVYRKVNFYLGQVTSAQKKSPHVLRHTFATHMLNNGADLSAIKDLLGHAGLAATQVYTHNTVEKLKNIYKKAHPKSE